MLFNSFAFLLGFLPITLAVFFILGRRSQVWGAAWLAAASLFFYGWWDYRYLPLILASITLNYGAALRIRASAGRARRWWLGGAVAANLALLAYYKYAGFFIANLSQLAGHDAVLLNIALPIGISFFTFTQIAFLVDTSQGKVHESRFIHYLLFVTYFPHLIAGPVLHHKEMMPQFGNARIYSPSARDFAIGFTIFTIGLAKKVLLADNIAPYANPLFSQAGAPTLLQAWGGVLAYAFQLYFDFSGYSDMAIGLSRLFGVRLPLNFNSPYKAADIVEFWRCWHMTLSRFLRDYLYIPLGGNRDGAARRYVNLMTTMVLGGLWHGAGWTFIIWGFLHGCYLVLNHAWAALAARIGFPRRARAWRLVARALTFAAVCYAWVFFRAPDVSTAMAIVQGMSGSFGVALPEALGARLGSWRPLLDQIGLQYYLGGGAQFLETWAWIAVAALVAFGMPNTQEIVSRFKPALDFRRARRAAGAPAPWLLWRPTRRWAAAIALLAMGSVLSLNRPSDFLYFQF